MRLIVGGVVLVHVGGGEGEQQPGGEGRRDLGSPRFDLDTAGMDISQESLQPRQIEVIVQTLPEGLDHDGEAWVPASHLE